MLSKSVFIFHSDGSYSQREYPSAESAASFARLALSTYPEAGVQHGDQVLQKMGPARD
jgi:hypothetical protein